MAPGNSTSRSMFWFFAFICSTIAVQKNITAESGQNVTLTCGAPNNNNILVAEWSRADLGKQCVLMRRDGHFVSDLQHPSFVNRVDLQDRQMKDGDVSLILKNVTAADSGTYECRVVQRRTNRRKRANLKTEPISIINLVVVPPGQPGGHSEDGGKKDGVSRGYPGLIVGLSVAAVLVVVVVVVLFIYRKWKQQHNQDPYQPPPIELQSV